MPRPAFVLVLAALAATFVLSVTGGVRPTVAAEPPKNTPTRTPVPGAQGTSCQPTSEWTGGEVTVCWLDVEQGHSQLVIGPTGKTLLIDLGERAYNSTGANTHATRVGRRIP